MTSSFQVLHIITGLRQGGAEAALFRLVSATRDGVGHTIVSLGDEGTYGPDLRMLGWKVHTLNFPRGGIALGGLARLFHIIRDTKPDVVQTWMYHADLVGGLVAKLAGARTIIWGVRNSFAASGRMSLSARSVARICAWISPRVPQAIICNSERAAKAHQQMGYVANKFVVIPNGFDLSKLTLDESARKRVRAEWGVLESAPLLGLVARWDPQKDHANLLAALARISKKHTSWRCVLVGTGMDEENQALSELIDQFGVRENLILAGPRADIPMVMNALDLHVLSSLGEAFPNVVAEAMACGATCVVTDVGDAAFIVGNTGWIVPPSDAAALAQGIDHALMALSEQGRDKMGQKSRQRIEENFSVEKMATNFVETWRRMASQPGRDG